MKVLETGLYYKVFLLISLLFVLGSYQFSQVNNIFSFGIRNENNFDDKTHISYNNDTIPNNNSNNISLNENWIFTDRETESKKDTGNILENYTSIIPKKSINSSDGESITIGSGISDYIKPASVFAESINKLLVIFRDNDFGDEYLFVINGSNILDYTKTKISGNNVLNIDGFQLDETGNKIYAYGDYQYLVSSIYEVKYGLGKTFKNHSLFVIDPFTSKIEDSITLWTQEAEGDETRISDIFINPSLNNLIAVSTDEGDLDDIYVIKENPLRVESVFSAYDLFGEGNLNNAIYQQSKNILYTCDGYDSLLGIDLNNQNILKKNLSNILCPTYLTSAGNKGFFIDHLKDKFVFVDLDTGKSTTILSGGNFSSINWDMHNDKTVLLIGHSISSDEHSCYSSADTSQHSNSYIIEIDVTDEKIKSIYGFDNIYIDDIIENPNQDKAYVMTTEKISDPNRCYLNLKLLDRDILTTTR
jgi:hypothetical protein